MARISEISAQKKNPDRVNLYIDGAFFCGLDAFTAASHRLKAGDEIDPPELERVIFDGECASAFEKSMRQINVRMRSEQEIRRYLAEKQYAAEVVDACIQKLIDYRYLDDAGFARLYAEAHRKKWGGMKIRYNLKSLGIDAEVLEHTLSEMPE